MCFWFFFFIPFRAQHKIALCASCSQTSKLWLRVGVQHLGVLES